mmetsp:Transcript_10604/g.17286  ORF Transcript_10604/g.17286 Transcript_10604/m.17286 type:complete len:275 (-) Transcript_10604:166-990(-)|eukprot:CAMPEP_0174963264 /NCGR_PEP_ID=MMETSP0004_2-20121128/5234_1 /TAXON_ID=420556 /ORGANISM="Ochromonas sp., Strain CCMP1393" /LENGTH=274 /DNA_ID=CAMNT_0016211871 /DNA_START=87 /DNA_END=914 /DNA_ORIENTATION=-
MNRNTVYYAAGFVTCLTLFTLQRLLFQDNTSNTSSGAKKKKAVFFGDSITQHGSNSALDGWVCKFVDWWVRRVDVINRGFSGYNTAWARMIVQDTVVVEKPDLVFIFFGANDAIDETVLQHVPLAQYKDNLLFIVNTLQKKLPNAQLVIITPPPIWEPKLKSMNIMKSKKPELDRTNERTLEYVQVCKALGKQYQIPVVDAWTALGGATNNRADFLSDGLHLNNSGNKRLFEAVRSTLTKALGNKWVPEYMPMHMPEWAAMGELAKQSQTHAQS